MPEFPKHKRRRGGEMAEEDAVLDVEAFHRVAHVLIDVSFRLPTAQHCAAAVAYTDAAAASARETDKWKRYPATRGRSVTPAIMASYHASRSSGQWT